MLSILAPASAGTWQTREAIPLPWSALCFPHPAGMAQAFEEGWVVSGDRNMSHIPVPIILSVIFFSHFFWCRLVIFIVKKTFLGFSIFKTLFFKRPCSVSQVGLGVTSDAIFPGWIILVALQGWPGLTVRNKMPDKGSPETSWDDLQFLFQETNTSKQRAQGAPNSRQS